MLRAHLTIELDQLFLEIDRANRHNRCNHDHRQRQLRIQHQQRDIHARDIRHRPEDIRERPRRRFGNPAGIAHHARQAVSRAGYVVVIQTQLLQIDKAGLFQVSARAHLHRHAAFEIRHQQRKLRNQQQAVFAQKTAKTIQRSREHKLIHRLALQQRKENVDDSQQHVAGDYHQQLHLIAQDDRQKLLPCRPGERRLFLFAHALSPSPIADCICAARANSPPIASSCSGVPASMILPSLSTMI